MGANAARMVGGNGMTNNEAIMILESIQPSCGEKYVFSESKRYEAIDMAINALTAQPEEHTQERTEMHACDLIDRQILKADLLCGDNAEHDYCFPCRAILERIDNQPSAQPEQRYTEEELSVFQHGISLSLLSKRSAQHWRYDEDTATEIKFLERLYEKVNADMRGEQDGKNT